MGVLDWLLGVQNLLQCKPDHCWLLNLDLCQCKGLDKSFKDVFPFYKVTAPLAIRCAATPHLPDGLMCYSSLDCPAQHIHRGKNAVLIK